MPRNRAVAVVIHENQLLVMYRKNTREFFTFPGGGIDAGETNEQATVREVWEEASLHVEAERLLYEATYDNGDVHYFFLCRYVDGTPAIQPGTNEYEDNLLGDNLHDPRWMPLSELASNTLYPIEIRDQLIQDVAAGFSGETVPLTLMSPR